MSLLLHKHIGLPGYYCGRQEIENFVASRALSDKKSILNFIKIRLLVQNLKYLRPQYPKIYILTTLLFQERSYKFSSY